MDQGYKANLESVLDLVDISQRLELRVFELEDVHDADLAVIVVVAVVAVVEKWLDFEQVPEPVPQKS